MTKHIIKIILTITVLISLATAYGCSQISDLTQGTSSKSPDIVRGAKLGGEWQMEQLTVSVATGNETMLLLRLNDGDKVDGYFYVEKGNGVSFQITGDSLIYEASTEDEDSTEVTSDRFSFNATEEQGNTYTLTFRNSSESGQAKTTIFLEVIYPVGGSLFMPVEEK